MPPMKPLAIFVFGMFCGLAHAQAARQSYVIVDDRQDFVLEVEGALARAQASAGDLTYTILLADTQVQHAATSSPKSSLTKEALREGFQVYACESDLAALKIGTSKLVSGVQIVPKREKNEDGSIKPLNKVFRFYKQFDFVCNKGEK